MYIVQGTMYLVHIGYIIASKLDNQNLRNKNINVGNIVSIGYKIGNINIVIPPYSVWPNS